MNNQAAVFRWTVARLRAAFWCLLHRTNGRDRRSYILVVAHCQSSSPAVSPGRSDLGESRRNGPQQHGQ